ncbi:hypothetical protein FGO68_gene8880 [Halteria grandinella]|uniref:Uncharacterized protein n=1 Tax=Halteria grandinella TaxID=5974 RepID=A0A8J8P353_HALGN|nr:hypothetical protein FGO68_gene8880 [Halteria grandinella]
MASLTCWLAPLSSTPSAWMVAKITVSATRARESSTIFCTSTTGATTATGAFSSAAPAPPFFLPPAAKAGFSGKDSLYKLRYDWTSSISPLMASLRAILSSCS